jgi:hypothetical protein
VLPIRIRHFLGGHILQYPGNKPPSPDYLISIVGQAWTREAEQKTKAKQ